MKKRRNIRVTPRMKRILTKPAIIKTHCNFERGSRGKIQAIKVVYILWIMTDLSVTRYIQKSILLGHNLLPSTSKLFCLILAQLLSRSSPNQSFFRPSFFFYSLARLSLSPILVAFKYRLIGVSATTYKGFWSQDLNFFNSKCNFRFCFIIIMTHEPCLAANMISRQSHLNLQLAYF